MVSPVTREVFCFMTAIDSQRQLYRHRALAQVLIARKLKARYRTIILVTHSLAMVRSWCDYGVWLHESILKLQGSPGKVVAAYVKAI